MIQDAVIYMLTAILGGSFGAGSESLMKSFASYNANAYNFAMQVNSIAVKPVAAVIVAIILTLELGRIAQKFEGDHKSGVQMVSVALIKAGFLVAAIQHIDLILSVMNAIGEEIIKGITTIAPQAANPQVRELPPDVQSAIQDMNTAGAFLCVIVLFVPWLISLAGSVLVSILVFVRFAELYILTAASTLPVAFLGHQETKSIAVGYLRKYGSVVLHGVAIILCLAIYSFFQIDSMQPLTLDGQNITATLIKSIPQLVIAPIFFIFLILSSGRIAKALVGEG
ncbi:type IV secretion system protein [Arcanobacterium bovis]|uniref:type IV secretion system protein n=2 Tax=Arcanobacterium bovis TaxID=2529275 RepID=UPI00361773F6